MVGVASMSTIPLQGFAWTGAFFSVVLFLFQVWPFGRKLQELLKQSNPTKNEKQIQAMKTQLANRITAIVHNLIQIPFALYLLMDSDIYGDHLYGATPASKTCLIITVGYFIVDSVICLRYIELEGPAFFFHGMASLVLYAYGASSGFLHYYGLAFLMWEVSTPFVHARWLMHSLHMHESKVYLINGLLMLSTFFCARCVYGIYLSYDFWMASAEEFRHLRPDGLSPAILWLYRLVNIGLNTLNFYWMTKMVQKASSFIKKKKAE